MNSDFENELSGLSFEQPKSEEETVQLIVFSVGREEYGLEIEKVQEVIRMKTIKKLPSTPEFILGVMNLRGNIIPVVGLREKFGLDKQEVQTFTRIIVVNHKDKLVGMVVDQVNQVISVAPENIEGNPDMVNEKTRALVRGVAKADDRIVIVVELDYLLFSVEEIESKED